MMEHAALIILIAVLGLGTIAFLRWGLTLWDWWGRRG